MKTPKRSPKLEPPRPVGARALKSSMDTLRPYLPGAKVLDLFCGTGRFGLSAAKEGALEITFVDKNRSLLRTIQETKILKDSQVVVHASDVLSFLETTPETYDLIFADPPFPLWDEAFAERFFSLLARVGSQGAILLVKYPSRMLVSAAKAPLKHWKSTQFGESLLLYFTYDESEKIS